MTISMPVEPAANELLSTDPLALLIGMLLDQQVPLEKAFSSPYQLTLRLGHEGSHVSVADIVDEDSLARVRAYKKAAKATAQAGKS